MAAPPPSTQNPNQPPSILGQPNASTVESLEQLRQRFAQLTHSLAQFQNQIINTAAQAQARSHVNVLSTTSSSQGATTTTTSTTSNESPNNVNSNLSTLAASIPQWPVMLTQLSVLLTQLGSLSTTINNHADILQLTVALPSAMFPTATQAPLATTLLRKKPLPQVEEWIKQAKKRKDAASTDIEDSKPISIYDQLWSWTLEVLDTTRDEFDHIDSLQQQQQQQQQHHQPHTASNTTTDEDSQKVILTLDQLVSFTVHGGNSAK